MVAPVFWNAQTQFACPSTVQPQFVRKMYARTVTMVALPTTSPPCWPAMAAPQCIGYMHTITYIAELHRASFDVRDSTTRT